MANNMVENELTAEELAFAAHDKVDALIDVLIEKKLLTENEFIAALKNIYNEEEAADKK